MVYELQTELKLFISMPQTIMLEIKLSLCGHDYINIYYCIDLQNLCTHSKTKQKWFESQCTQTGIIMSVTSSASVSYLATRRYAELSSVTCLLWLWWWAILEWRNLEHTHALASDRLLCDERKEDSVSDNSQVQLSIILYYC